MTRPIDYSQFNNVVWHPNNHNNSMNQTLIYVPGGTFMQGDTFGDGFQNEQPKLVETKDFYMAATATSLDEFDQFCDDIGFDRVNDEGWGRENMPAINVNWYMAIWYCNWLSEKEGLKPHWKLEWKLQNPDKGNRWDNVEWLNHSKRTDGTGYTLPDEAQYERAARVLADGEGGLTWGAKVRFGNSKDIADPREMNFDANDINTNYAVNTGDPAIDYRGRTVPVDTFNPSDGGFFNMSGNTWEWTCQEYGS